MTPDTTEPNESSAVLAAVALRASSQAGGENFPVALRVLPREPRAQLTRVYAYARFVDDIGDEAPGDRVALLDQIDADVRRLGVAARSKTAPEAVSPRPTLRPVAALGPVVAAGVPLQPFLDLVAANVADQRVIRYATFDDLIDYCRLSAAPVGRIVLHLARAADERNMADSDDVCHALQVLEHCQDVGEDARAGRVYLPADELHAAGVDDGELTASATPPALRAVVAAQVDRAEALLRAGTPLVGRLHGWARPAVAGYVAGGLATVDALRAAEHDVLGRAVRPSKLRTAVHAARLLAGRS
jgi:squalene synthase HpnC